MPIPIFPDTNSPGAPKSEELPDVDEPPKYVTILVPLVSSEFVERKRSNLASYLAQGNGLRGCTSNHSALL